MPALTTLERIRLVRELRTLMSQLAGNARRQGRRDEALDWSRQSFEASVGPATRLQWGAGYVSALVELAPTDPARIEAVVTQLLREAAADPGAFSERSGRSLKRVSDKLAGWNGDGRHDAVMQRLRALLSPTCSKLDAAGGQRALCEGLFRPALDKA